MYVFCFFEQLKRSLFCPLQSPTTGMEPHMQPLHPVRFDSIVSLKVVMECYGLKEGS